jgi:hypothetical protein
MYLKSRIFLTKFSVCTWCCRMIRKIVLVLLPSCEPNHNYLLTNQLNNKELGYYKSDLESGEEVYQKLN